MTVITSIANRKGGTGKTTVATHLAGGLAARGHNVLLIDTDPQGHAGMCLGVRKESGLFNLLVDNAEFQEVVRPVNPQAIQPPDEDITGKLFVLPSDEKTQVIPMLDKNPFHFKDRLDEIDGMFDFVIFDTAPTVTMFDGAVYLASESILYVTECEKLSLDGLNNGLRQLTEFTKQRQTETRILGILPNKLRKSTENHKANLAAVRERFGVQVWEPITQQTALAEATNFGKLIYSYSPTSNAATDMWQLVDRFEQEVAVWANA